MIELYVPVHQRYLDYILFTMSECKDIKFLKPATIAESTVIPGEAA